ncbi:MAG TPA: S8 family peptidase [Prolixibacteraceae bacterium]|nr:S8 family peptidase [Prolixibacteraceae bacterium]
MAENRKPHLLLKNQIKTITKFPKRGMGPSKDKDEEDEEEIEVKNYEPKKKSLRKSLTLFQNAIQIRHEKRTIQLPTHIDYVKIYFHGVFNPDLQKKFRTEYGLSPIRFEYFNKVILLAVVDEEALETFKDHISFFIETEEGFNPLGTDYYLLVHIEKFELLDSSMIIQGYNSENIILDLVDNTELTNEIHNISNQLIELLESTKASSDSFSYEIKYEYSFITLKNSPNHLIETIVDNFDIFYKVQSHTYKIGPDRYSIEKRRESFEISPIEGATLVGIIDTGVQQNSVLRNVIENFNYDLTNPIDPLPILDLEGHGTSIAMLAALGTDFYDIASDKYKSAVKIVPIKVLENENGNYSIIDLENIIRDAAANNIKLFNLSINESYCKLYNESISEQAFLLDKLAHELNILFFISTGNLDKAEMIEMRDNPNSLHNYPNHFFNPGNDSNFHSCEFTNIHSPAESFNNVSVGAIAENLNDDDSDLTYSKDLPAYYSKKYHLNYSEKINGLHLTKSVINNNLFKPDLVAPGGDAVDPNSGMEVLSLRPGILTESSYGTSNAAPLITNMAARILNEYPNLNSQTIKALLINSAGLTYNSGFLNTLIEKLKDDYINNNPRDFEGLLTRADKMKLSKFFNKDRLLNYLAGHGLPNQTKALFSNDNSATLVIEESIKVNCHKGLILKLPQYLKKLSENESEKVVTISATLCYSFNPIFNNSLAYNPIHISFALFKPVDNDLSRSIDIIAGYTSDQKKRNPELKRVSDWSVKERKFRSDIIWSEDYSPVESKPFSNTQKISYPFRIKDLLNIENELNIIVRCTTKTNIDPQTLERIRLTEHKFSLVIRIEEKEINGNLSGKLYSDLQIINTLEVIVVADLEAEI